MILFPLLLMISTLLYSWGMPFLPTEANKHGNVRQKGFRETNEETPLLELTDDEVGHVLRLDNLRYAGKELWPKQGTSQNGNSKHQINTSRLYFTQNSGLEVNNSKYGVHLRNIGFKGDEGKLPRTEFNLDPTIKKEEHFPPHSGKNLQYWENKARRDGKLERKKELIIKVGNQEIRIRPDYVNQFPHEPDYREEKKVQFPDPLTGSKGYRPAHEKSKPGSDASVLKSKKSYSDVSNGESHPEAPSDEYGNPYYLESIDESGDSLSRHTVITEQIDTVGLFDYEFTAVHPETNDHSAEFEHSENFRKVVSVQIHDKDTISDCQPPECVETPPGDRNLTINGFPIQENRKGNAGILERRLPTSVSGEESEIPDTISKGQIQGTFEYPPLLIEEIDISHAKHLIPPEFFHTSTELFPTENAKNRITEKHPELQSAITPESTSSDKFDTLNFSEKPELRFFEDPVPTSEESRIPSFSKEQILPSETSVGSDNVLNSTRGSTFQLSETPGSTSDNFNLSSTKGPKLQPSETPDSKFSENFLILDIENGSGDKETVFLENDATKSETFKIDASEELIFSRKFSTDLDENLSEGSGAESEKTEPVRKVSPRIINVFATQNDSSTPCTTPKGEAGHCKDVRHCLLHEVFNNFNAYLQYVCLIRGIFIGVCCPDNPVISQPIESDDSGNNTESTKATTEFSQPAKGCGVNFKTRIVGGTASLPHEWTWMVALMKKNRFFCGGVLINNWYVLTAAHCTLGVRTRELTVRFGEYNFLDAREHQEDIGVKEIKRHAQFITLTFQHDIALLKLKRSVEFSQFVGSICLPRVDQLYNNVSATVVGWGTVSYGGSVSPVLREVILPVWNNTDCDRTYIFEDINDSFLCAGSPKPNQDACQGDSGGPLMAMNEGGRWEAIGIVSWGRRCGDPKYPGVYTRITTYLDWIEKNMT